MSKNKEYDWKNWKRDENTVQVFVNESHLMLTQFSALLEFAYKDEVTGEQTLKVRVSQSPTHIKALARHLSGLITEYESLFGEIVIDPKKKSEVTRLPS